MKVHVEDLGGVHHALERHATLPATDTGPIIEPFAPKTTAITSITMSGRSDCGDPRFDGKHCLAPRNLASERFPTSTSRRMIRRPCDMS